MRAHPLPAPQLPDSEPARVQGHDQACSDTGKLPAAGADLSAEPRH